MDLGGCNLSVDGRPGKCRPGEKCANNGNETSTAARSPLAAIPAKTLWTRFWQVKRFVNGFDELLHHKWFFNETRGA